MARKRSFKRKSRKSKKRRKSRSKNRSKNRSKRRKSRSKRQRRSHQFGIETVAYVDPLASKKAALTAKINKFYADLKKIGKNIPTVESGGRNPVKDLVEFAFTKGTDGNPNITDVNKITLEKAYCDNCRIGALNDKFYAKYGFDIHSRPIPTEVPTVFTN